MNSSDMTAGIAKSSLLFLPLPIHYKPKYYKLQYSNQYIFQLDQNYTIQNGPQYLPQAVFNTQKIAHEVINTK